MLSHFARLVNGKRVPKLGEEYEILKIGGILLESRAVAYGLIQLGTTTALGLKQQKRSVKTVVFRFH